MRGAINRSVYFHYRGLLTDINQPARAGVSLVTRCPVQGKILQKLDASGKLSRRMLKVNLPFLQDLSLQDIFHIRTDYEQSVIAFRRALHDCAVEMERASGLSCRWRLLGVTILASLLRARGLRYPTRAFIRHASSAARPG